MEGEDELLDSTIAQFKTADYNCYLCKHLNKDRISCKAFPDVMPSPILTGQVAHTKKMYNQKNDIVFEKK